MTTSIDEQMALLLQTARDFAFTQISRGQRLIPFAACVPPGGSIDFARLEDEASEVPLGEIYDATAQAVRQQAASGGLVAAALIAAVEAGEAELGAGFVHALRIHLEAPGFAREVLIPFRVTDGGDAEPPQLVTGGMVPFAIEAVLFVETDETAH